MIRARHGLHVERLRGRADGDEFWEAPKPLVSLDEAPFPDFMEVVMRSRGWTEPTPIQIQGWPVALDGHDMIGIAATGSGKTMVYILPMLVHIIAQPELKPGEGPIGLILVPNRELCDQVAKETQAFSTCFDDIHCLTLKGGEDGKQQEEELARKADIIVATPGRLIHHLNSGMTNLRRATYVVLDEADMLLEQKFEDQTKLLLSQIRPDRQVLLFSATWDEKVEAYARDVCKIDPIKICVGCGRLAACKDISQNFAYPGIRPELWRKDEPKAEALCRALRKMLETRANDLQNQLQGGAKALVFCNTVEGVQAVVGVLQDAGLPGEGFTRELCQEDRNALIERFHYPDPEVLPVLVSTSALARGHDFRNVRYVINYDMPWRLTEYVHRIGRTGRAGMQGFSLTFLEKDDLRFARDLVGCLTETEQEIPKFLQKEARFSGRYWREYRDRRRREREEGFARA